MYWVGHLSRLDTSNSCVAPTKTTEEILGFFGYFFFVNFNIDKHILISSEKAPTKPENLAMAKISLKRCMEWEAFKCFDEHFTKF